MNEGEAAKTLVLIPARMASTRLPGKVLMPEGATNRTLDRLAAADVSWTTLRYAAVQKNGGGLHCSTTPLIRDPV